MVLNIGAATLRYYAHVKYGALARLDGRFLSADFTSRAASALRGRSVRSRPDKPLVSILNRMPIKFYPLPLAQVPDLPEIESDHLLCAALCRLAGLLRALLESFVRPSLGRFLLSRL